MTHFTHIQYDHIMRHSIIYLCAPNILREGKGYPRAPGAGRGGYCPAGWLHIYL